MRLGPKEYEWIERVTSRAVADGWQVYQPSTARQRQHDPTLILTHVSSVLMVWLRSARPRPDRQPPIERFASMPGVKGVLWCPSDWAQVQLTLTAGRFPDPEFLPPKAGA
ncbi:hypothetical protein ACEZDB_26870 [Streptacidiphilus sp. N1-3]|uniref:Uncharacterized protein n=1 Tax=Streptacidiphilus alkalitolerans TaxID=3342712 RepID=A0ABV6X813_9ACTN